MAINIEKEVAILQKMTVGELREKYVEVWDEPTNSRNRVWLIKRIAWRMQALEYGDLSERARQRAAELARDADIRILPPREKKPASPASVVQTVVAKSGTASNSRLPMPGTVIARDYKGRTLQVEVIESGFVFEGETYKSLSAVAKHITGQHLNGYHFFRLNNGAAK